MAYRESFFSTTSGTVTDIDTGLEIKTGYADGATVYALFGSNAGSVILKHVFEDNSTPVILQTVACAAGILNVINIAQKSPHLKIFYSHTTAGDVKIERVTSLGQI